MDITRPEVSPETEFSYVDKSTGRAVSFAPKPDEAMVTFQGRAAADTLNEVVEAVLLLSVSQDSTWNVGSRPSMSIRLTAWKRQFARWSPSLRSRTPCR